MKRLLLILGGLGAAVAAVLTAIPATAPIAPALSMASQQAVQHAQAMPDDCDDAVCRRDTKGLCHMCGPVAFLDGGHCVCR